MRNLSTTPLLFVVVIGLIALAVRRVRLQGYLDLRGARAIYTLLVVLFALGVTNSMLAIGGVYASPSFRSLLPGLWLPLIPFLLAIGATLIFPALREALRCVVDNTPRNWSIFPHGLRILAIGTIIKAVAGQFPAYFAFLVGAPDFLFGLSAIVFGWQASVRQLSQRFHIAWNLIGVAVILPAAPLIQLGLPGPIQIFTSEPTAEKVFDFPMVLAPSIIVPTLVLLNLATAWRLIETRSTKA